VVLVVSDETGIHPVVVDLAVPHRVAGVADEGGDTNRAAIHRAAAVANDLEVVPVLDTGVRTPDLARSPNYIYHKSRHALNSWE